MNKIFFVLGIIFTMFIAVSCQNIKVIATDKAPAVLGPYSQGLIVGDFVYTSGQIPINVSTGKIPEGIVNQTEQALENIKAILEAGGSSIDKVVKVTVFIKDMNDFNKVNEVYSRFFTKVHPARSCIEVARLPKDVLIEIEAVGVIK